MSALDLFQMDDEAREAFLSLSREEQLLAILSMETYVRAKLATLEKRLLELEKDLIAYRKQREEVEQKNHNGQTQRIIKGVIDALRKLKQ